MFYQIKVLIAAAAIYIAYKDVTAAGAVEQARTVVNEVEKQCKKRPLKKGEK